MKFDNERLEKWSKGWPTAAAGDAMCDACEDNKDVIVLAADLAGAVGVDGCSKYEGQFFNVGIAEQNMVGIACGLALTGKIPVATSFVPFLTLRASEQIRTGACYMDLNVKLLGRNGGVMGGRAGASHHGVEDISVMRAIPNMKVFSPSDGLSLYKCIRAMIDCDGPAYVRMGGRGPKKVIYSEDFNFEIGKAIKLTEGDDVAILANGPATANALDAAEILKAKGIGTAVYDFLTVKPLDVDTVAEVVKKYKVVLTAEENVLAGGFGSAVAEAAVRQGCGAKISMIGLPDQLMGSVSYTDYLSRSGLLPEQIAETAEKEFKNI